MQKLLDASTLSADELIERWKLFLRETQQEAFHLYSYRFMFENIAKMFSTNDELQRSGFLYEWLLRIFVSDHMISIRRELQKGSGYLNLANFLIELAQYSQSVLTRARYVALYPDRDRERGSSDFDVLPGATCGLPRTDAALDYISSASITARAKQLESDTKRVVSYANWVVAHRVREKEMRVTLAEMYRAVNRIFDTYALYYRIMTGSVWMSRYPTRQYDWQAPFRISWITDGFQEWEPPKEAD